MTEQSIRRRILLIMAMSGGEIKKEICMELCGSKPYYKKMMQQMKEKGEAETIFGCHPRTLHIKKNAVMKQDSWRSMRKSHIGGQPSVR